MFNKITFFKKKKVSIYSGKKVKVGKDYLKGRYQHLFKKVISELQENGVSKEDIQNYIKHSSMGNWDTFMEVTSEYVEFV